MEISKKRVGVGREGGCRGASERPCGLGWSTRQAVLRPADRPTEVLGSVLAGRCFSQPKCCRPNRPTETAAEPKCRSLIG